MTTYKCPNCEKTFTEDEVANDDGVYSETNSDPYTGLTYENHFCKDCVDEYRDNIDLLHRIFRGNTDKLAFKLRKVRE